MLGDFQLLPMPSTASFDTAGKYPLQSSQLASVPHRVSRVGYSLARGERCQPRDSKIDPDLLPRLGECGLRWLIQTKTHEVSPGTVLGYRDCAWRTCEVATPLDVEATDLGDEKPIVFSVPFESSDSIFSTLLTVLGSKSRILRPLGEEVTKSRLQMPQSLLLRDAGTLSKKSKRRIVPVFSECGAAGVVVHWLASPITVRPQPQCEVIGMPSTPELLGELPLLATRWIGPECVSNFH
jgi:hypothetical protein